MDNATQQDPEGTAGRRTVLGALGAATLAATFSTVSPAHAAGRQRPPGQLIGPVAAPDVHAMSFNIRMESSEARPGQPDYWPERIPALQALLRLEQPTVLGVQEAEFHQLAAVTDALPATYRMVGYGREGGWHGEHCSIFYDGARLRLVSWNQFWLSDAIGVIGSRTWGNRIPRVVTWGRFADRATGREFVAANTHLDHESENARVRSARLMAEARTWFAGTPMILMGDFNASAAASSVYSVLVGSETFRDTWRSAGNRLTPAYGTSPGYGMPAVGGRRIDWILGTDGIPARSTGINPFRHNGRWPSDHLPVQALLRL